MAYYNTTRETGDQLKLFVKRAKRQDEKMLEFLRKHPNKRYTPEALRLWVFGEDTKTPITSVRRALTNLKDRGLVVKSETADGIGDYGNHVHTWRAA
jgi:Fe2+ or Zn2+ uptake regulation protein